MFDKLSAAVCAAALVISGGSASAFDATLGDDTYFVLSGDAWVAVAAGGDDEGLFARGTLTGVVQHVFTDDIQGGFLLTLEGRSNQDDDIDNIGDGPRGEIYRAYAFAETRWGNFVAGKTFGAVTELVDVAPSAIELNYGIDTPFFIHVMRPRFAPRSATMSPDFLERTERVAYYSPDGDGFRIGVSYAPELQDDGKQALTSIHSNDAIEVAVVWRQPFDDGAIRLSAGYQQAAANVAPVNMATAADQSHWSVGARVDLRGFQVSGGMQVTENTLGLRNIDNVSYQGGVLYGWDDFSVSASYGFSEDQYSRNLVVNPILGGFGDARVEMIEVAARYQHSAQMALSAAITVVDYEDEIIAPTAANDGVVAVVQLHFGF